MSKLFLTKPLNQLTRESESDHGLKRALSATNLTTLGIGAIIGAGIFVLTGQAAAQYAGPAIVISFVISGFRLFVCGFMLCRVCINDPNCRKCLHLRLCYPRGIYCLDNRLGT